VVRDSVLESCILRNVSTNKPALSGRIESSCSPYQDQRNFLPPLGWTPEQSLFTNAHTTELDARSWLSTQFPVEKLAREIKKSSQFTVRIVCAASTTQGAYGRIVSLSQSAYDVNFLLQQEGVNLVFWFRNPLSDWRSALTWTVRGAFEGGKERDIVASYDGSDAFLYLDGNRVPQNYRLSPGASLVHRFLFIRTAALEGYVIAYEALIFFCRGIVDRGSCQELVRTEIPRPMDGRVPLASPRGAA
jgi:hypothetical protein